MRVCGHKCRCEKAFRKITPKACFLDKCEQTVSVKDIIIERKEYVRTFSKKPIVDLSLLFCIFLLPLGIIYATLIQIDTNIYQKGGGDVNTKKLSEMMSDKHFFDLRKMQHKYSQGEVSELLDTLQIMSYVDFSIADFEGKPCRYLPSHCNISTGLIKKLLKTSDSKERFGKKAMTDEIEASLLIENIHSNRESVRKILDGFAPENDEESRIYGMKKGLDFIAEPENKITEENLHKLYMLSVGDFLESEDRLPKGSLYRNDAVFIVGDKEYHKGIAHQLLPSYMAKLIGFANKKDEISEPLKAAMLHFYFAYLHPYFDGNGRTARLFHLWYLVQQGFPSTLFYAFSEHINSSKQAYYNSFLQIESNAKISGRLDLTPFILYFNKNVYSKIESEGISEDSFLVYKKALEQGTITEKERELWGFVLSAYGGNEFSTKELERDFGNAAYATIRGFVLKFETLGLFKSQSYGNRKKYCVVAV